MQRAKKLMNDNICYGCMSPKGPEQECRKCGYIEGTPRVLPALTPGTVLAERYIVGRKLSSNGEGIEYIALDRRSNRKVTIREYLPGAFASRGSSSDAVNVKEGMELVYRDYLEDFLEVSRAISRLSEVPSIIPVTDIFETNNTAYAVYEYVPGKPLSEVIRRAERLTWDEARPIFLPLMASVSAAHSVGLVHFGINPESIIMTREGRLMLRGFGVPDARLAETEFEPELFDGYSALEQYAIEGRKGKWTDVYAMSAVIFFALTGKRPPDAVARSYEPRLNIPSELSEVIPMHVVTALSGGLQVQSENRISTMDELKSQLSVRAPSERPATAPRRADITEDGRRQHEASGLAGKFKWIQNLSPVQYGLLAAGVTVVVLGLIALLIYPSVARAVMGGSSKVVTNSDYTSQTDVSPTDAQELYGVPSMLGLPWENVKTSMDYDAFDLIEMIGEYSDDYAEGLIMRQNVTPGSMVPYGTPIGITVSMGSKMRRIPNIIGQPIANADAMLASAGLVLGSQTEEYSNTIAAGCVISIVGASVDSRLEVGSSVNVKVSLGPDPMLV